MSRPPITRRYRLEPLAAAMGAELISLGRRLNIGGSTWVEYRDEGVSPHVAERLAVKAGFHPANIWPSWWDDQWEDVSVECADEKCSERFVPVKKSQRYCSVRCRERRKARDKARRKYQSDPEWAAAQRERVNAYRAEVADGLARARRAAYHRDPEPYRQKRRERYAANPEVERERQRQYRARAAS